VRAPFCTMVEYFERSFISFVQSSSELFSLFSGAAS
jgi:hypothetical protein